MGRIAIKNIEMGNYDDMFEAPVTQTTLRSFSTAYALDNCRMETTALVICKEPRPEKVLNIAQNQIVQEIKANVPGHDVALLDFGAQTGLEAPGKNQ
jgi:hypothetical protein